MDEYRGTGLMTWFLACVYWLYICCVLVHSAWKMENGRKGKEKECVKESIELYASLKMAAT